MTYVNWFFTNDFQANYEALQHESAQIDADIESAEEAAIDGDIRQAG